MLKALVGYIGMVFLNLWKGHEKPCQRGHTEFLVGGFNPFEKYESNWESSPNGGEHIKYLKQPSRFLRINMGLNKSGVPGNSASKLPFLGMVEVKLPPHR